MLNLTNATDISSVFILKIWSPRLQLRWLQSVENNSSRHLLDCRNIKRPKSKSKVEMEDVNAKKPDDVVDVENSFRAKLGAQLIVDKEKQDIKYLKDGPPKHGCMGHLGNYQHRNMLYISPIQTQIHIDNRHTFSYVLRTCSTTLK